MTLRFPSVPTLLSGVLLLSAATAAEPPVTPAGSAEALKAYYRVEYPVTPRPPELVAAGRDRPDFREAEGFEALDGWTLESPDFQTGLRKSAATRVFGEFSAELRIAEQKSGVLVLRPPRPIPVGDDEHAALLWTRTLQYRYAGGPVFGYALLLRDGAGREHRIGFPPFALTFRMWTPMLTRLDAGRTMPRPWSVTGIRIQFTPRQLIEPPYFILLDSLQFFPDPLDGPADVPPLPLPKPSTAETIRPLPRTAVENTVERRGRRAVFTARGGGDTIRWTVSPKRGDFGDLEVEVNGRRFRPCAGGGPVFELEKELLRPGDELLTVTLRSAELRDGVFRTAFQARSGVGGDSYTDETADYEIDYALRGKTLIIDFRSARGQVAELNFGDAELPDAKRFRVPYLRIDHHGPNVVDGGTFYLSGLVDFWNSDGTTLFALPDRYNGGVRYEKLTDGRRNPARERLMLSVSGDFAEVLPNLPNPVSPYRHRLAAASWRWGMNDVGWAPRLYRQGVRDFQLRTHADLHRDIEESYGYRAAAAPSRGEAAVRRLVADLKAVGFGYAPYNAYTELNPFSREFSVRSLRRDSNGQFRNYHQIPAAMQRAHEKYAPEYVRLYAPTFSYLDVHGAREPWRHPDMRAGSWMAGKFRGEFLANAAVMARNREIFGGPCFTEGNINWIYAGFYDLVYGYLGHGVDFRSMDDIVDFSLLAIRPHAIQLGMGDLGMYYRGKVDLNDDVWLRRYITATLIYGHAAMPDGDKARVYFLTNAVQRRCLDAGVQSIDYSDGARLMPTREALHTAARGMGLIRVGYDNGTVVYGNLNRDGRAWTVDGRTIPAPGFYAVAADGSMEAFSLDYDFVRSPEYLYCAVRGNPVRRDGLALTAGGMAIRPDGDAAFLLYPQPGMTGLELEPAKLGLPAAAHYRAESRSIDGKILGRDRWSAANGRLCVPAPRPGATEIRVTPETPAR